MVRDWKSRDGFEEECQEILRLGYSAAHGQNIHGADADDCATGFLTCVLLKRSHAATRLTDEERNTLHKQADSYCKRFAFRRSRKARLEPPLHELTAIDGQTAAQELMAKEPGPEDLAIMAEAMERLLKPLPILTPAQQQLFVRHFLDRARLVDLQDETGRSANALYVAVHAIRARVQRILAGEGMDMAEATEYLRLLSRHGPRA